jgi:hypothetical protein
VGRVVGVGRVLVSLLWMVSFLVGFLGRAARVRDGVKDATVACRGLCWGCLRAGRSRFLVGRVGGAGQDSMVS